jgi:hypothetical protein
MNGGFSRAVQNRNHVASRLPAALTRAAAILLASLAMSGCSPDPLPPDTSTRESFARTVMSAAASGSVEQVENLVMEDRINVRPEAERLVQFAQGWNPGSGKIGLGNDFPEIADVSAWTPGHEPGRTFTITWSKERWALVMGDPAHPPAGGASGGLNPDRRAEPTKDMSGSAGP